MLLNGTDNPRKFPPLLGVSAPLSDTFPWAHLSLHPKRHLDRFSRFCMGPKCHAVQFIISGEENPQNCPFALGFHLPAGRGPSHGDRQHAEKIWRVVRDISL